MRPEGVVGLHRPQTSSVSVLGGCEGVWKLRVSTDSLTSPIPGERAARDGGPLRSFGCYLDPEVNRVQLGMSQMRDGGWLQ